MRKVQHVFAALGLAALASLVAFAQAPAPAGQAPAGQAPAPAPGRGGPAGPASFFITSVGKGDGANYGGLAGADAYCAQMAQAGGIPTPAGRNWRGCPVPRQRPPDIRRGQSSASHPAHRPPI